MRDNVTFKIKRAIAFSGKVFFLILEKTNAILFPVKGLNILFSANQGFEKNIRKGFKLLPYKIDFNEFTVENIQKSNLIVPLHVNDVRALSQMQHLVKDKLIPIPDAAAVEICDNKYLFNSTLIEKGFGNVVPKIGTDLRFPFFVKKKRDQGGANSHLITNAETKEKYKDLIDNSDYFCQEMVSGPNEFATHILFKEGKIVNSLTIKYTFFDENPINGRDKFVCSNLSKCAHLDTFASILAAIGYEGLCCFDYKVSNGTPYIFEINPRLGGSLSTYFFTFLRKLKVSNAA